VNGFISNALGKVARFAVSKAAAFSYAVAVGVAGNLVFHFVQPQVPIPSFLTGTPDTPQTGDKPARAPAATATVAPKQAVAPIPEPPPPAPSAMVSVPVAPPPAPPPKPAFQPPERPTASLPDPAPVPSPTWKPLQLPSAPAPSEATAKPMPAPSAPAPNTEASNPTPPAVAALPPLGPAIDVAQPPMPPERVRAPEVVTLPPPPSPAAAPPPHSLELSDFWHPYRAVKKGLNWASDQLPVIGGDGGESRPPAPAPRELPPKPIPAAASVHAPPVAKLAPPAEPIPLLPTKAKPELADAPAEPAKPVAPGPGSGGLY
jgi:hypothetical protein